MPPDGKLPEASVATMRQWVALGAPWSTTTIKRRLDPIRGPRFLRNALVVPAPGGSVSAPGQGSKLGEAPVDTFVLARLEAAGMTPSARADKRTLIRRATIDLWGIPPTADEIAAFEHDTAPDAFARLVDRLLASPRYGERWGRHWLDVAGMPTPRATSLPRTAFIRTPTLTAITSSGR